MKILLINNNPVVSRLTALSARKENISLDEIKNISELKASDYNIIFVDGESYNNDVSNIIRNSGVEKRVLFYAQGEEPHKSVFTKTILKPFLPSEVSEILREMKVTFLKSKKEEKSINFQDLVEETKEKELEVFNIKEPIVALASTDKKPIEEEKKIEEEKIDLEKDGFDLKIEKPFPLDLDDNKEKKRVEKESNNHKKDMFDLDSDLFEIDDKKESLKEGFDDDLFEIDKEIKKDILDDSPLDFDTESKNEVYFSSETPKVKKEEELISVEKEPKEDTKITNKPEVTTKVLNNDDIADIKDILEEKEGSEELTEIPNSLMSVKELGNDSLVADAQAEIQKKKKKKHSNELTTEDAIAHTLSKLPIKDLRRLLRGATINISIQFPNDV
jgi:uncharacterized membrane protein